MPSPWRRKLSTSLWISDPQIGDNQSRDGWDGVQKGHQLSTIPLVRCKEYHEGGV